MIILIRIFTFFLFLTLIGCSHGLSSQLIGESKTPITTSQVTLYDSPPISYQEIAALKFQGSSSELYSDKSKSDFAIKQIKAECAALGANGFLIKVAGDLHQEYGETIVSSPSSHQGYSGSSSNKSSGPPRTYYNEAYGYAKVIEGIAIFVPENKTKTKI